MKVTINTKNLAKKNRKIVSKFNKHFNKTMKKYRRLILNRARRIHKYNNISGFLTRSTNARLKNNIIKVSNNAFYNKYVVKHYNEDWISNSVLYYESRLRKELKKVK